MALLRLLPDDLRTMAYSALDEAKEIMTEVRDRGADGLLICLRSCTRSQPPPQDFEPYETESERNLAAFLEPYSLAAIRSAVFELARAGYNNKDSLTFVTTQVLLEQCERIEEHDRNIILLAAWLHSCGMDEHGPGLVDRCEASWAR